METEYVKGITLRDPDAVPRNEVISDTSFKELLRSVQDCVDAAYRENIKANTIVINENMVKIKPFLAQSGFMVHPSPPMLCGLNVYFDSKDLPDGYSFAVLEGAPRRQNLDMSGAVEDIFEKTLYDREVIAKILNMARDYWEV
jgi:hypothetical protein